MKLVAALLLSVVLVTDEPEAVLSILAKRAAGEAIAESDWQRLFTSPDADRSSTCLPTCRWSGNGRWPISRGTFARLRRSSPTLRPVCRRTSSVAAGFAFYGVRGPWYSVGWKMAVVIEKTLGRATLVEVM